MRLLQKNGLMQVPTWLLVLCSIMIVASAMLLARGYFYDTPEPRGFTPATFELDSAELWHVGVISTFEMLRCMDGSSCFD